MKKIYIYSIAILIVISSCSGILWNSDDSDELKISINNPFYQGGSPSSSRALALQGDYLYIELALIKNQAEYNADSNLALTGNGSWVSTSWGGHAILTFDLNNWTETLEAVFTNVPRGQDLKARVILDTDQGAVEFGIEPLNYDYENQSSPISSTYDADAPDIFSPTGEVSGILDQCWVSVTSADLSSNVISLPIRPEFISTQSLGLFSLDSDFTDQVPETYVDQILQTGPPTEPNIGETLFTRFEIDTDDVGLFFPQDITFYAMNYVDRQTFSNGPLPGVVSFYSYDGSLITEQGGDIFSLYPSYPYRIFSIIYPELDASYYNGEYFIGSTLFSGPELVDDGSNYAYGTDLYNVVFGVLNDGNVSVESYIVNWNLPPYFNSSDLEFKVIETTQTSLSEGDLESLNQIYSLAPYDTESSWITGVTSYDSGSTIEDGSGKWVIILARLNGGSEIVFIYGVYYITMV